MEQPSDQATNQFPRSKTSPGQNSLTNPRTLLLTSYNKYYILWLKPFFVYQYGEIFRFIKRPGFMNMFSASVYRQGFCLSSHSWSALQPKLLLLNRTLYPTLLLHAISSFDIVFILSNAFQAKCHALTYNWAPDSPIVFAMRRTT